MKFVVFLAILFGCGFAVAQTLHTDGSLIRDERGLEFKLASVNWAGAEQREFVVAGLDRAPLHHIVRSIKEFGFNSVRILISNELVEKNPLVPEYALEANPEFKGQHALDILDAVIFELANANLRVILDNHVSHADWCCGNDENHLWYTPDYPEQNWIDDWVFLARRYALAPAVIGFDLRNEPREGATWGGAAATDWASAAERAGNAIQDVNPNLLVIVEGVDYASDLRGVAQRPIQLSVAGRLVYSVHDYSWYHQAKDYASFVREVETKWGFVRSQGAPIWIGEFGLDPSTYVPGADVWFEFLKQYLTETKLGWSYWALNGTENSGVTLPYGRPEGFGIFDTSWKKPKSREFVNTLRSMR